MTHRSFPTSAASRARDRSRPAERASAGRVRRASVARAVSIVAHHAAFMSGATFDSAGGPTSRARRRRRRGVLRAQRVPPLPALRRPPDHRARRRLRLLLPASHAHLPRLLGGAGHHVDHRRHRGRRPAGLGPHGHAHPGLRPRALPVGPPAVVEPRRRGGLLRRAPAHRGRRVGLGAAGRRAAPAGPLARVRGGRLRREHRRALRERVVAPAPLRRWSPRCGCRASSTTSPSAWRWPCSACGRPPAATCATSSLAPSVASAAGGWRRRRCSGS